VAKREVADFRSINFDTPTLTDGSLGGVIWRGNGERAG
jgi:hypothetical protein